MYSQSLSKDLLCLLLQQEEDSLIKIRINSGIPLLIQGGANYSEPKNLFRNRGGPFLIQINGTSDISKHQTEVFNKEYQPCNI
jgi:hypothetical protein